LFVYGLYFVFVVRFLLFVASLVISASAIYCGEILVWNDLLCVELECGESHSAHSLSSCNFGYDLKDFSVQVCFAGTALLVVTLLSNNL